jgi:hypothetical protein
MAAQPQGDLRGLKALVGILGVMIVLGTALVIGVVIHRLYAKPSAQSTAAAAAPAAPVPGTPLPPPAIANRLPEGDYIKSIAAAGADVAIWVAGPEGDRILLYNPVSGRITVALSAAQ